MRWPWARLRQRRAEREREAQRVREALEAREARVQELGAELREARRRNHFSDMVNAAFARTRPEGDT